MRKEVVFILLLIVAIVALLSLSSRFNRGSEADARKFFAEDLASNYPEADAREILTSAQVGEGAGVYYLLKARVSYNLSTPCPSRWEVEYYYPPQSFVRRTPMRPYLAPGLASPCIRVHATPRAASRRSRSSRIAPPSARR